MNGREKEEAQSDAMPELAGQYQQHHLAEPTRLQAFRVNCFRVLGLIRVGKRKMTDFNASAAMLPLGAY